MDTNTTVLTDDSILHAIINACDSLNITRAHEITGGMWQARTIADDTGLIQIGRAIERAVIAKLGGMPTQDWLKKMDELIHAVGHDSHDVPRSVREAQDHARIRALPAASEAERAKLQSAYAGACEQIDRLLREKGAASEAEKRVAELEAARMAYASEFALNADGEPDVGNIHANIRALKATVAASEGGTVYADSGHLREVMAGNDMPVSMSAMPFHGMTALHLASEADPVIRNPLITASGGGAVPVAWRYWNEKSQSWNTTTSQAVADAMREGGRAVEPLSAPSAQPEKQAAQDDGGLPVWWGTFIQNISEIPDRNSPDDEPEAMIATRDDLENCALNAIEAHTAAPPAPSQQAVADASAEPMQGKLASLICPLCRGTAATHRPGCDHYLAPTAAPAAQGDERARALAQIEACALIAEDSETVPVLKTALRRWHTALSRQPSAGDAESLLSRIEDLPRYRFGHAENDPDSVPGVYKHKGGRWLDRDEVLATLEAARAQRAAEGANDA
ncbi:hypothetical protein CAL26_04960 [Bordetella genomosp. 9]|uniref:Uncharacterized protein n=1 Tax=Bordetella genomosp. 9 TaxID=1416803 RepID=A0A261RNN6_9BORD|nr:hypothetical protein [Bordetella genomosp. 9]OZI26674.1 hypothetical protein CAL26_04960 [Bordetella genomosp. 9]